MANPPCRAAWQADAVFVGTVVEITRERIGGNLNWIVQKVAVTQNLRGSVPAFMTLTPAYRPTAEEIQAASANPGESTVESSCDYDFEQGRQYIFYARRTSDGRWTTSKCSGTKRIDDAAADLDYFADLPSRDPSGRVYGRVERTVHDPHDRSKVVSVPAAGVRVSLVSQSTQLTIATDSDGKLDVQVPPGDYTIRPLVPSSVRVYGSLERVLVAARGCAPIHFSMLANGRIEGRVLLDDGSPVPRVFVVAVPVDMPPSEMAR